MEAMEKLTNKRAKYLTELVEGNNVRRESLC